MYELHLRYLARKADEEDDVALRCAWCREMVRHGSSGDERPVICWRCFRQEYAAEYERELTGTSS